METLNLSALAAQVRDRAPGTPLDRVEAAIALGEELASSGDQLVGYFVAEARRDGCSWTEIGQRMGVSKQAARQRFVQQPTERPAQSTTPGQDGQADTAGRRAQTGDCSAGTSAARPRLRRRGRGREVKCSFCGKPRAAGLRLVAGPGVYICAECIGLAGEILAE